MKFFWKPKEAPVAPTIAEQQLEQICNILFPPLELKEITEGKCHIDRSLDTNLDVVLIDIEEGFTGPSVSGAIKDAINRLNKVRHIIGHKTEVTEPADYLFVDYMKPSEIDEDLIIPISEP